MLQYNPTTGKLLINEDGSLLIECCCNQTEKECNCCCDTTVPPWLQPSLKITIESVKVSDQGGTNVDALSCLVGEWVLPWGDGIRPAYDDTGTDIGTCKWYNTFTAGIDTNMAVFKMTATLREPKEPGASSNPDTNAYACIAIKIDILSCKDCEGDVWLNQPRIFLNVSALFCGSDYPEGSSNASSNADFSNNCGCSSASQEHQLMPWVDSGESDPDPLNYDGMCWNHPRIQAEPPLYDGHLYLHNPRWEPTPPPGDPLLSINLSSLIQSYDLTKNEDENRACTWTVEANSDGFGGEQFNDKINKDDNANCQYNINAHPPYITASAVVSQLGVGYVYTAYTNPIDLDVGCDFDQSITNQLGYVITPSPEFIKYYLVVDVGMTIAKADTCAWDSRIHIPEVYCPGKFRSETCQCQFPGFINGGYEANNFNKIFPSGALSTTGMTCSFPEGNSSCVCTPGYYCCVRYTSTAISDTLPSLDEAPVGARYDIIFEIDKYKISVVYEKDIDNKWKVGSSWKNWELENGSHISCPMLSSFAFSICTGIKGKNGCTDALATLQEHMKILPSTVNQLTLNPNGLNVETTNNAWKTKLEVAVKQTVDIDRCCPNVLSKYYNIPVGSITCKNCALNLASCARQTCDCITTGGNSTSNCSLSNWNVVRDQQNIPQPTRYFANGYPDEFGGDLCGEYISDVEMNSYYDDTGRGNCGAIPGTYNKPAYADDYIRANVYSIRSVVTGTWPALTITTTQITKIPRYELFPFSPTLNAIVYGCVTCTQIKTQNTAGTTLSYSESGDCTNQQGSYIGSGASRIDAGAFTYNFGYFQFGRSIGNLSATGYVGPYFSSRGPGLNNNFGFTLDPMIWGLRDNNTDNYNFLYSWSYDTRRCGDPGGMNVKGLTRIESVDRDWNNVREFDIYSFGRQPGSEAWTSESNWSIDINTTKTLSCGSGKNIADQTCFHSYTLNIIVGFQPIITTKDKAFRTMVNANTNFTYITYPGFVYMMGSDGNVYCVSANFRCFTDPSVWYSFDGTTRNDQSEFFGSTNILCVMYGSTSAQTYFLRPTGSCDRTFKFTYIGAKICNGKDIANVDVTPPSVDGATPWASLTLSASACLKTPVSCSSNVIADPGVSLVPYYFNDGDEIQYEVPGYAMLMGDQGLPLVGVEGLEYFSNVGSMGLSGLEGFA